MESGKRHDIGNICVPGMRVSVSNDKYIPGPGTHEIMGYIYASVAGILKITKDQETKITTISVESPKAPSILPKPGDIITGRITVVNPRLALCTILCVNENVLTRTYKGVIKKEDVKFNPRNKVDLYKCFKPGDIVLAKVLPMTEIHFYPLSTAENDLGVVIAKAEGAPVGVNMIPINWSEMQCPKTLVKEKRKVARVIPETLNENLTHMEVKSDFSHKEETEKKDQ